jgi:hypothetical protein
MHTQRYADTCRPNKCYTCLKKKKKKKEISYEESIPCRVVWSLASQAPMKFECRHPGCRERKEREQHTEEEDPCGAVEDLPEAGVMGRLDGKEDRRVTPAESKELAPRVVHTRQCQTGLAELACVPRAVPVRVEAWEPRDCVDVGCRPCCVQLRIHIVEEALLVAVATSVGAHDDAPSHGLTPLLRVASFLDAQEEGVPRYLVVCGAVVFEGAREPVLACRGASGFEQAYLGSGADKGRE